MTRTARCPADPADGQFDMLSRHLLKYERCYSKAKGVCLKLLGIKLKKQNVMARSIATK